MRKKNLPKKEEDSFVIAFAKKIALTIDKDIEKPFFSVQRRDNVEEKLKNTVRHTLRELSGLLIDKYSVIDVGWSESNDSASLDMFFDKESFVEELTLQMELFFEALKMYSKKINE